MKQPSSSSDQIVLSAPLSFNGSSRRIWKLTARSQGPKHAALITAAIIIIIAAWALIAVWYLTWGLLLVPYRIIRRGHRRDKRQQAQHRELLRVMDAETRKSPAAKP